MIATHQLPLSVIARLVPSKARELAKAISLLILPGKYGGRDIEEGRKHKRHQKSKIKKQNYNLKSKNIFLIFAFWSFILDFLRDCHAFGSQ